MVRALWSRMGSFHSRRSSPASKSHRIFHLRSGRRADRYRCSTVSIGVMRIFETACSGNRAAKVCDCWASTSSVFQECGITCCRNDSAHWCSYWGSPSSLSFLIFRIRLKFWGLWIGCYENSAHWRIWCQVCSSACRARPRHPRRCRSST